MGLPAISGNLMSFGSKTLPIVYRIYVKRELRCPLAESYLLFLKGSSVVSVVEGYGCGDNVVKRLQCRRRRRQFCKDWRRCQSSKLPLNESLSRVSCSRAKEIISVSGCVATQYYLRVSCCSSIYIEGNRTTWSCSVSSHRR